MATTISSTYHSVQRKVLAVSSLLSKLDETTLSDADRTTTERELSLSVNEMSRDVSSLDALLAREPTTKRNQWRSRCQNIKDEAAGLR